MLPERTPSRGRRNSVDILVSKAKSGAAAAMQELSLAPDPKAEEKRRRKRFSEAWAEPSNVLARHVSSMQHGCGSRFVMKESNPFRKFWNFVIGILLLYTGTVFPYKLAFIEFYINSSSEMEDEVKQAWFPVEQTVDILFWTDLFLIFVFSYKDEKLEVEVCDLKKIFCRYVKGFFFINLVACIPPSWFGVLFGSSEGNESSSLNKGLRLSRLHRTSRLARLARLGRLAKLAPFLHESATWKYIQGFRGVRMMNLCVGLMWVVHLMACGWYLCAALHEKPEDTWVYRRVVNNGDPSVNDGEGVLLVYEDPGVQWVHALYFILTIFTTVGFGDMSAFTTGETLYVDWAMIVGTVVNSIIMSEVITTLTGVDRAQAELNKRYGLIKEFAEHTRMSVKATSAFEKAVQRASHAGEMRVDPSQLKSFFATDTLPRELMLELTKDVFQGKLLRNELLVAVERHGIPLPPRLALMLAAVMHPKNFQFMEDVYQNADQPVHIYLVMRGTLAFVGVPNPDGGLPPFTVSEVQSALHIGNRRRKSEVGIPPDPSEVTNEQQTKQVLYPYKLFGVLSYLGEYEPLADLPTRMSYARVESEMGAEVLVLHKKDLLELRSEFPACSSVWVKVARRKEWHRGQLLEQLRIPRNYKKLALHTIQSFYRKHFKGKVRTNAPKVAPGSRSGLASNGSGIPTSMPPSPSHILSPNSLTDMAQVQQRRTPSVVSQDVSIGELQRLRGKVEVMDQRMLEMQHTLDQIMEELKSSRPS